MPGLDRIFAASRDLVFAFDKQGAVTYRNPAAAARGLEPAMFEQLAAAARAVAASGKPDAIEWGERNATSIVVWFSTELSIIDDGVLTVSRDVTVMRRREQLMVDSQGVAHFGTWEWDVSQPNATWSAELFRIYGLSPETYTPSYEGYLKMVHPDDRQRVIDATNRVFHEHVPYSHDERIMRPDGSLRHLHTWAYPVLDDTQTLTHLIGVCQDITDRALLEAFNAMVTHDLRAPLTVIQMSADLLVPVVKDDPKGQKHVDRIKRALKNSARLMDDLLAYARVGEGRLEIAEVDLTALATELLDDLRDASPDRNVAIEITPNLIVPGDPRLIRVLFANLIDNAWKYTKPQAQPRIEITKTHRDGMPMLVVRDNGIGFDPADRERVFLPFERLRNAKELPGSGIGLAIVEKIADRHLGRIEVEAEPGAGASFYVWLPNLT